MIIQYGDKSEDVKRLQRVLINHAALPTQLPIDGDYGPNTARGVLYLKTEQVMSRWGDVIGLRYNPDDLRNALEVDEKVLELFESLPKLPTEDEIELIHGGPKQWFDMYASKHLGPGHLLYEMSLRESNCAMIQKGVITCGCDPVVKDLDDVFALASVGFITSWGFFSLQLTTPRGRPLIPAKDYWSKKRTKCTNGRLFPDVYYDESLSKQAEADFLQQKFDRNDKDNKKKPCSYKSPFDCRACILEHDTQGKEEYYEQEHCSWLRASGKWAGRDKWAEIRAQHVTDAIYEGTMMYEPPTRRTFDPWGRGGMKEWVNAHKGNQ